MTEFDLFVEAEGAPPAYSLLAVSPQGVARESTTIPTTDVDFEALRVRVCGREKGVGIREQFGQRLFDAVFRGAIRGLWSGAAADPEGARLRLIVEPPGLSTLPWELLNDGKNFLATDAALGVSRYIPVPEPRSVPLADKVKVLLVTASPAGLPEVKPQEVDGLAAEIEAAADLTVLPNANAHRLGDAIASADYHVVHYLGHGTRGALLLEGKTHDEIAPLTDRAFAQMLFGRASMRLVVLSACSSAQTDGDAFAGVGPALIRTRVPAVVAMQYDFVQLSTARAFNRRLYVQLAAGVPIDVAVNQARNTISATSDLLEQRDWSTPVLYLGTRNGRLITLKSQQTAAVDKATQSVALAVMKDPTAAAAWRDLQDTFESLRALYYNLGALMKLHELVTQAKDEFNDIVHVAAPGILNEFKAIRDSWDRISSGVLSRLRHDAGTITDASLKAPIQPLLAQADTITSAIDTMSILNLQKAIGSMRQALIDANLELTTRTSRTIAELVAASERTLGRIAAHT